MRMRSLGGGTGYNIQNISGREEYTKDKDLPPEVEHIYPDYSLYGITDTAYGYMTRGCPRGCDFCIVGEKEGRRSVTVAKLSEFWRGQKNIVLLDPNPIASKDWKDNFRQLIESNAYVNFSQGVDIRLMTGDKAEVMKQIRVKRVHFAWDRWKDKDMVVEKLKLFRDVTGWDRHKISVFVLTNFDTTIEQDLERIYLLRDIGVSPYLMIYDKYNLPKGHQLRRMQRWCNNRFLFRSIERFEDYV